VKKSVVRYGEQVILILFSLPNLASRHGHACNQLQSLQSLQWEEKMKKSLVFMGVILGLFLNAFPWPEVQVGATQSSSVLVFRANTFKSFSHPSSGAKFITFEASVASTMGDYMDGQYSSFLIDVANAGIASMALSAYNTGSKFKVDYTKDADFLNRPVMMVKVFALQE
jgi:hypothetical protein